MKTTLNKIFKHGPCQPSWEKGLRHLGKTKPDDEPINFLDILEVLGVQDTVWCLRTQGEIEKEIRLLAVDFAEHVLPVFEKNYPEDKRPRKAIQAAREYAAGTISKKELRKADVAAVAAYYDAAYAAAAYDATAAAADAAAYAVAAYYDAAYAAAAYDATAAAADAAAAARTKETDWQKKKLIAFLKENS